MMSIKKSIFLFSTVLLLGVSSVDAQSTVQTQVQNQCVSISSLNVGTCCTTSRTFNNPPLKARCDAYRQGGGINGPSGGTQQTNPINVDDTDNGDPASPQAGSVDLSACSGIKFKSALDILVWVKCVIVTVLIPLIFSLAFLVFLWGVFKFMTASDVKGKQEGQKVIWWGMLGLFVMVSVWGIIQILNTTLGIESAVPMLQTEYLKRTP